MPSTTHNGSRFPCNVLVPRIWILGAVPTRLLVLVTTIPATRPCNIWSIVVNEGMMISFALMLVIDPTMSRRWIFWYPVTTTSSISVLVELFRVTLMVFLPVYFTVFFSIPIKEYVRINPSCAGILNVYCPSNPAMAPCLEPRIVIVAPGKASPLVSRTQPLMVIFWLCLFFITIALPEIS